jgi:hypothetical protein
VRLNIYMQKEKYNRTWTATKTAVDLPIFAKCFNHDESMRTSKIENRKDRLTGNSNGK